MSTVKVASIHFAPLSTHRLYGRTFELPAVPLGAPPAILECFDMLQYDDGPYSLGSGGRRQKNRYPVLGEEQAADVVREWTQGARGTNQQCHPGVWAVRDKLPMMHRDEKGNEVYTLDPESKQIFRPATEEETVKMWEEDLAAARESDRQYAEWCWNDGNDIAGRTKNGNGFMTTPPLYKLGARQYGLEAEWLKSAAAADSKMCPNCGKPTSRHTFICASCQQPTDLEKWAEFTAKKEASLRNASAELKKLAQIPPPLQSPAGVQPLA